MAELVDPDWAEGMDDSLALAVFRAETVGRELRTVNGLEAAATQLIERIDHLGCHRVVAASREAEPLATAAALLSQGRIQMQASGEGADKVIVIDAATVTGNATRSAAERLREEGVSWVGALVYNRIRPDLDELDDDPLLDQVTSLSGTR